MSDHTLPVLLSPKTLLQHLGDSDVLIVYVSKEEKFLEGHIPGAVQISHSALNYGIAPQVGHLPPIDQLQSLLREIGLSNRHHVVSYDDDAGTAAARLFWVLEALGHRKVSFLDGGFLAWNNLKLPVSDELPPKSQGDWRAVPDPNVIATKEYVFESLNNSDIQILDSRTEEEHVGIKSASDRKGHIPGAISFNWLSTRDTENLHFLKPVDVLQKSLQEKGFDQKKEIVAHCQTHQRSCHSYMMLRALGYPKVRGFAGSWSEWAADPEMPVVNLQES